MKKYLYTAVLALLLAGVLAVPGVNAHEGHVHEEDKNTTTKSTDADTLERIKKLMAQIEELKKQLNTARGEVKEILKKDIAEGSTSDDMKKIQEILATDESIYPEGKVTGYYGPLTKEALKRFQKRHELEITGVIDEDTRALLEEYLGEKFENKIPPGLLKAPGIMKKVELRAKEGCSDNVRGKGVLCAKLKMKYKDGKDKNKDEDSDDSDEDETTDNGTMTFNDVQHALKNAMRAIADAKSAIDDADDGDEAKEKFSEARKKLDLARSARNHKNYDEAVELAKEAEKLARDAEDLADESDSEDDEDEDSDDED